MPIENIETDLLVLAVRPYRETSRLLDVLTRTDGRLSIVARGSGRGKSRAGQNPLSPLTAATVRMAIRPGSDIGNLAVVEQTRDWPGIRAHIERFAWACLMVEVAAGGCPPRAPSTEAFDAALMALADLNNLQTPITAAMALSHLESIVSSHGSTLGLNHCQDCGRTTPLTHARCHGARPGAICAYCARPSETYSPLLSSANSLRTLPLNPTQYQAQLRGTSILLAALLERTLGHSLNSVRLLTSLYTPGKPPPRT